MICENVWIARHGVRFEQLPAGTPGIDEPYNGPAYDRPLPPLGLQQAEALAERMADIPIRFLFSSPFHRTIQTVVPLARRLGLPIKLEWGLCEFLRETWFEALPDLPTTAERHREFPEVDPDYTSHVLPRYPETDEDLLERTAEIAAHLTLNYGPDIFLMGHGASTQGVRRALLGRQLNFKSDYCGISHLARVGDSWEYRLAACTMHLMDGGLHVPLP